MDSLTALQGLPVLTSPRARGDSGEVVLDRRPPGRRPFAPPILAPRCSSGRARGHSANTGGVHRPAVSGLHVIDIPIAGPLLSIAMSVIAQAIADRQNEIDRLQAEIKALTDVEQILGASAPPSRSTSRRSSSPRKAAAAAAPESTPESTPERKRRKMSAAEKKAVSERMTAYWAERRKKVGKK